MYNEIFEKIKKYNNIVIARHIGVDPDAMASAMGLKKSISLTFPEKNVFAIGNGSVRFNFLGHLDKGYDFDQIDNILLIITDTPDSKRVDKEELTHYEESIKIDHHPFMEKFCDIEHIDPSISSASELVYDLIENTDLVMNKDIAEILFAGIIGDTNRFLFGNSIEKTFNVASDMIKKYNIDITKVYYNLYKRPLSEVNFFGYMATNMVATENSLGYIKIPKEIVSQYKVDPSQSGNLINEFNNIDEFLVWVTATEDEKNKVIRVSARSRGPVINKTLEKYNGGGHAMASGAKLTSFEEVDKLLVDLDELCKKYKEESDINEN